MEITVDNTCLELVRSDIIDQATDAIVNAANRGLAGNGGVDGAIHRAGGPQIIEKCCRIWGCPTGQARITTGGDLKARYVVHAVGPVYNDGVSGESSLLAKAYRNSSRLVVENDLCSVAFLHFRPAPYRLSAARRREHLAGDHCRVPEDRKSPPDFMCALYCSTGAPATSSSVHSAA